MKPNSNRRAAIVGGVRIPFVKSFGPYRNDSNQDLLTFTLQALIDKYKLSAKRLGDVACGAVIKHSRDWNLTRECVLGTTLDPHTPAWNLQRACGTSLEATNLLALKILSGQIEVGIAGGSDTNSDLPIGFTRKFSRALAQSAQGRDLKGRLTPFLALRTSALGIERPAVVEPRTGLSMGEHCEKMVKEWGIGRKEQDELALQSHLNAAKAFEDGFYDDLVMEYHGLKRDPFVRGDTSMEKLARLKPAFDRSSSGTLTAGNSSPLTDGASAVLIASEEYAKKNDLDISAYFIDAEVAAVDFVHGEGLLMAPTYAVPALLKRQSLSLQDFDFYEIHEAFAGQVLCTLKAWESEDYCRNTLGLPNALGAIDRSKLNLKGSSVALGHPFAATGTRIVATLAKQLAQKGKGRGLISICTAGGMGVAAILER